MNTRKIFAGLIALTTILVAVAACAPAPTPTPIPTAPPPSAYPLTITDGADRQITIAKLPQRLISLAPSTTEILFAIGQGSKVVAVDQFSDFPAEVKALTNVGGSRGKYNLEQIVALNPDVVFAAGITGPETVQKLEELKLTVVVVGTQKTIIERVMSDIALAGKITGASDQAKQVTEAMQKKLDALKAKAAGAKKVKVFWELDATDVTKPYTVGPGNFVNDLITLAGGENVFASASTSFPQVGSEQVVAANPDVIILSDFAYGITIESVKARKGWAVISAVKNNKIFPIDDNLVSRPGPRVVDGLEAVMRLIHPELF